MRIIKINQNQQFNLNVENCYDANIHSKNYENEEETLQRTTQIQDMLICKDIYICKMINRLRAK